MVTAVAQVAAMAQIQSLAQELPHAEYGQKKKKDRKAKHTASFHLSTESASIVKPLGYFQGFGTILYNKYLTTPLLMNTS